MLQKCTATIGGKTFEMHQSHRATVNAPLQITWTEIDIFQIASHSRAQIKINLDSNIHNPSYHKQGMCQLRINVLK